MLSRRAFLSLGAGAGVTGLCARWVDTGATSRLMSSVASPVASPLASPVAADSSAGLIGAVARRFEAEGLTFTGLGVLVTAAMLYETAEDAAVALPLLRDGYLRDLSQNFDVTALAPTTTGGIEGDQVLALAGTPALRNNDAFDELGLALLGIQEGTLIRFFVGASLAADVMQFLVPLADLTKNRRPGFGLPRRGQDGLYTGGLWDVLPSLSDAPAGLVHVDDEVLSPGD